jgi:hypothetical protein
MSRLSLRDMPVTFFGLRIDSYASDLKLWMTRHQSKKFLAFVVSYQITSLNHRAISPAAHHQEGSHTSPPALQCTG